MFENRQESSDIQRFIERYQGWGFSIIPVESKNKKPLVGWLRYQNRKPTSAEIQLWHTKYWSQGANIGVVCGRASGGLVVLDVDNEAAWADFINWWKANRAEDIYKVTPVVKTWRGYHVYLRCRQNIKQVKLKSGIEIKADGGVIAAPPSIHPTGITYQFVNPDIDQILEINDLSDVGIDISPSTDSVQPSIDDKGSTSQKVSLKIQDIMDGVAEGMRNDACFRYALWHKSNGLSQAETLDSLVTQWAPKCTPPFPKQEVESCVKSAYSYKDKESPEQAQPPIKATVSSPIIEDPVMVNDLEEGKYQIRSGEELINSPVPDIEYRISGLLRANGGRLALVGQYKMAKSLLAHSMAFKVAAGEDWLGFKTIESSVLYVNLEISKEKFQERTQEFQNIHNWDKAEQRRFKELTVLDMNLKLDTSIESIQFILKQCEGDGFKVDILILDPRARCISGSENEEVVIKSFCHNVDLLLKEKPCLSVVIVTHMGKDASKGAIGHSRFSGWLDTEIKLTKGKDLDQRYLTIVGRDCESTSMTLDFKYPILTIVPEEETERLDKVGIAKAFILEKLSVKQLPEQQLKAEARQRDISDYAFHTAIRELKDEKKIATTHTGGKGNRKILELTQ